LLALSFTSFEKDLHLLIIKAIVRESLVQLLKICPHEPEGLPIFSNPFGKNLRLISTSPRIS
jgi:hypothetical protein